MPALTLTWSDNYLRIAGSPAILPGGPLEVHYLEAYCRAGAHEADWSGHTVIPHSTRLVSRDRNGTVLKLRCLLGDGVTVDHTVSAGDDEVAFQITTHNPTAAASGVHWAQPCIRVGAFAGAGPDDTGDAYAYIKRSWVFLGGELALMPTPRWATEARYTPGQVWAAPGVPRADVNPRPLHPDTPTNGLIGCFSGDGSRLFATAFEPYQELFQGVIRCLHSDFRIGGLEPGETKTARGKVYLLPNDIPSLLERYQLDFPQHGGAG